MPYYHFPISPGPAPPPDSGIRNFPGSLSQLSQSAGMSSTVVTVTYSHNVTMTIDHLHNVNHVDHVTRE